MKNPFEIGPQKANARLTINNSMIGVLFMILTFILTLGGADFNFWAILQLVLAVPLLYVSVLSYSKVAYWKDNLTWDAYGWITSNLANNIILNAIGLMMVNVSEIIAIFYFGLLIILMVIYSLINIKMNRKSTRSKLLKLAFFLTIVIVGGILPLTLLF